MTITLLLCSNCRQRMGKCVCIHQPGGKVRKSKKVEAVELYRPDEVADAVRAALKRVVLLDAGTQSVCATVARNPLPKPKPGRAVRRHLHQRKVGGKVVA